MMSMDSPSWLRTHHRLISRVHEPSAILCFFGRLPPQMGTACWAHHGYLMMYSVSVEHGDYL